MSRYIQIFFRVSMILSTTLILTGCNKENPTPELLDPIYRDLTDEAKKFKKLHSDKEKEIVTLLKEGKELKVRSVLKKVNGRDLVKAKATLVVLKQKAKY